MSSYRLTRDELLEYPGLNGSRALCHLRVAVTGATIAPVAG